MRKLNRQHLVFGLIAALTSFFAISILGPAVLAGDSGQQLRPHAKIDAAISALDDAKDELENAGDDFHGHKKDALRKVEEARGELDHYRERGGNKEAAMTKIDDARAELHAIEEKHPRIHKAVEALVAAKDELE